MANHVSAAKRHIQSEKRRLRNRSVKSALHTQLKKTRLDVNPENVRLGQQSLAIAARKGVLHWKTAARRISRLMKALKA
ncbi:MAG: 30S ribosomal protein S20 [Myxococcota bacterium]